jgi:RNA polymerase sigma factor (TIGR02999 family)
VQSKQVTRFLNDIAGGDAAAKNKLFAAVYEQLKAIAARELKDHHRKSLQPTLLLHDAYVKMIGDLNPDLRTRSQFYAFAATVMRNVLLDYLRARATEKRGGGRQRISLDPSLKLASEPTVDLLALSEALDELAKVDERQAKVVELKFYAGLEMQEIADAIGVSVRTVKDDWRFAKAWLRSKLDERTGQAKP